MDAIHTRGAKSAKGYGFAIGNLGSQFADIGVSLASGQALWLVAIQQGSQIAGVFGMMAASAGGLRGALAGMAATLAPAVAAMAPFLIVAGAAAAAMALFHREVSKGIDEKALVAGLKLTEEQLKRVKDHRLRRHREGDLPGAWPLHHGKPDGRRAEGVAEGRERLAR
jgi:hypothetical protein